MVHRRQNGANHTSRACAKEKKGGRRRLLVGAGTKGRTYLLLTLTRN